VTPTEFREHVATVIEEGFRLMLVLLVAIAIYLIFIGFAAAIECRERPGGGRSHWTYRIVDGDRCWYPGRHMIPKSRLYWPNEQKPNRKIKGDPVFNAIRAEEETSVELGAVTWHMKRPFDEAKAINPPLNLAVPSDPDVWPDLSEFERRFVGVQP
jgi:hypothetical protein